jgi:hypothetical protein
MEGAKNEKTPGCLRFDLELAAYLEGEAKPFIAFHVQNCPACRGVLSDLEQIRTISRELPLEEPLPVVWANIRAVLAQEGALRPQARGWRRLLTWQFFPNPVPAAVLAGLVAFGLILTTPTGNLNRWNTAASAPDRPDVRATFTTLSSEDNALAQLVKELETTFRANQAQMAPDMKATYDKSLDSLNTSIQECLISLREEPSNKLAHDYLLTAYTRKAEVLSSALEFEGQ